MTDSVPTQTLQLPVAMRDEIIAHARAEAPRECCGVIVGANGTPERLHRLTNLDPGTDFYRIDDTELYRVYRDADDAGQEFVVIYHSHPVSPAYPSSTDVRLAAWPDAYYLICSLQHPDAPALHAFRIEDERITEVEVVIP